MGVKEKMTAIADAIREKTGKTQKLGLDAMATGIGQVYDAGKQAGQDAMWDIIQNYGNRPNYQSGFSRWGAVTIKPKYPVNTATLYELFYYCDKLETLPMVTCANADGKFNTAYTAFQGCAALKSIDFDMYNKATASSAWQAAFDGCKNLVSIQKLGVLPTQGFSNAFRGCYALEEVRFDGEIGQSGLDLHWSTKLSKASIESIINALSTTTSGLSITLSKTAVNTAFDDDSGYPGVDCAQWGALVDSKPNWTISLV